MEIAWAAGFIDGEGTFGIQRQKGRRPILYLQAGQTDRQVLDRLRDAIGDGKVYGPYQSKNKSHSPYFYFRITGNERTERAALKLWRYLSPIKIAQYIGAKDEIEVQSRTPLPPN